MMITNDITRLWVDGNLKGGLLMLSTSEACWIRWSIVMSPRGRTSTERGDTFSGRVLVLWMDHGRKTKDGASLARVGSEAVRTCSEGSPTSYHGYASCPSRCGCCLLRVCFACRFPSSRGVTRSRTTSLGSIQIGTLGGSTVYPILSSSTCSRA